MSANTKSHGVTPDELFVKDVSRCHGCLGYVNHLCVFEKHGWVCALCGMVNDYANAANTRYLGGPSIRDNLPELQPGIVEATAPLENGNHEDVRAFSPEMQHSFTNEYSYV